MKYSTIVNKIANKPKRPVLENFLFHDGRLSCTDLEMVLTFTYPNLEIREPEHFLVNATMLSKLLDNKGFLSGQIEGKSLELYAGKSNFKLPVYPADDFIKIPMIEGGKIEIEEGFMEALKKASHCANKEKNRLLLNSIKLDFKNGLVVATDQVRLSAQNIQKIEGFERDDIVIPLKAFEVLKALPEPCAFRLDKACISFLNNDYIFTTRLVETQFPNYVSAIETYKFCDFQIPTNKEDLAQALKDLDLVDCAGMKARLKNGSISMTSPKGEASFKLAHVEHDTIGLNHHFLSDYIKTIDKEDKVNINFNGPKRPIIIHDKNGSLFMSPVIV